MTYTVTLDKAATEAFDVAVAVSGTATAGTDFVAPAATLSFAVGQTSKTIDVVVNGDTTVEADETVILTFSGTKLAASVSATGTITNDDTAPGLALTTATTDNLVGTTAAETFTGVLSAAIAEGTLQASDKVDGDAGADTLSVDMQQSWTGFTTGSMKNVETVKLVNKSTAAVTWDAKGSTGVTGYNLDASKAVINLSNVDTLATIEVKGPAAITADTDFTVAYAATSTVATGTQTDTQVLKVTDVGTINTAAATAASNAKFVKVNIAKVEALDITTAGTANSLDLSGATDAKSTKITGAGQTEIKAVSAATTSFDASGATGKVVADLNNATPTALTSVKTGSGDDVVLVSMDDLTANSTVALGTGADRLDINAATSTIQATVSGVETIRFTAPASVNAAKFSGTNVTGLEKVEVQGGTLAGALSLVNMGSGALTLDLNGDGANVGVKGQTISADNTGAITVNMKAGAAATAVADDNTSSLTFNSASGLTVNVGELTTYATGTVTYGGTGTATLNVASKVINSAETTKLAGTVTANAASKLVIAATGQLNAPTVNAGKATSVEITTGSTAANSFTNFAAAEATSMTITAGSKNLDMGTATLTKLQSLTASTGGLLDFTGDALGAISTVNLSGTATTSQVTLNTLGTATTQTYNVNLTATGLKAGLTTGDINAGTAGVTVDVSGVTGFVKTGNIAGDASVTYNAKNLVGKLNEGLTPTITSKGAISVDVSNASAAAVFGTITSTAAAGDVSVLATSSVGGLTTGKITGNNVTVNGQSALGTVLIGNGVTAGADIEAKTSVTYTGTNITDSGVDILANAESTSLTVNLAGGAAKETFTVTGGAKSETIKVTGDIGAGQTNAAAALTVTLVDNTGANKTQIVDLSGFKGSDKAATLTTTNLVAEADSAITYKGSAMNDTVNILVNGTAYANAKVISITDTTTTDSDTLALGKAVGGTAKAVTLTNLSLSGIENVVVTATGADADNTVSINASAISAQSIKVSGSTTAQKLSLSATDGNDVIDLSSLTTDGTNFIQLVTTGGKGNDTIALAPSTSTNGAKIIDQIVFSVAADNGTDTITGFTKGATDSDILNLKALATLIGTGGTGGVASTNVVYVGATAGGTKGDTAVSKAIAIGAADNAAADWSNVVTKISGALTIAGDTTAANAATAVLISNGTDTRVYLFSDDATNNSTVEATELTLVGTLSGVITTGLVEGNFIVA